MEIVKTNHTHRTHTGANNICMAHIDFDAHARTVKKYVVRVCVWIKSMRKRKKENMK